MNLTFTNSAALPEAAVAPGGVIARVQLSPLGDFPNGETVQHVTAEAVEAMVADWTGRGSPEILCDFEHGSEYERGSTEAAAWITNLALDPERGFVGDFKFTDRGAEAVTSRHYRFLSPVWLCRADAWKGKPGEGEPTEVTPFRFLRCALTNTPNLSVAPLLNKAPSPVPETVERKKENKMKNIAEALGLAPDATEEDILGAVRAVNSERDALKREKAESEAEAFAEANKAKCDKEVLKAQYLANKEATVALVNAIPAPAPKSAAPAQTVLNRAATPPEVKGGKAYANAREEMNALPPRERAKFYAEHRAEIDNVQL